MTETKICSECGEECGAELRRMRTWVNLDVKESRNGKWYAAVNTYTRQSDAAETGNRTQPKTGTSVPKSGGGGAAQDDFADDVPF